MGINLGLVELSCCDILVISELLILNIYLGFMYVYTGS